KALAAAFISNCAFAKRNLMVEDLQKYGVKVDSYGNCMHNKDEVSDKPRDIRKLELLSEYKFSLAFENSETDDYITEKFFLTLASGSVPVYIGAPNVKFFAPDAGPYPYTSKSVIYAGDFGFDAQRLAKYLLYLDKNDTAYAEYLQWKVDGYSGDFKALNELTSTHTACRVCVFAADRVRLSKGLSKVSDAPLHVYQFGKGKTVFVRERGSYRFIQIQLNENVDQKQLLQHLIECILLTVKRKTFNQWKNNEHPNYNRIGPAVYAIYHVPSKHVIHSNDAVLNMPNLIELEFISV
ncbi:hypothetical protein RFI_15673, partial [Reticulomyxa filosa]